MYIECRVDDEARSSFRAEGWIYPRSSTLPERLRKGRRIFETSAATFQDGFSPSSRLSGPYVTRLDGTTNEFKTKDARRRARDKEHTRTSLPVRLLASRFVRIFRAVTSQGIGEKKERNFDRCSIDPRSESQRTERLKISSTIIDPEIQCLIDPVRYCDPLCPSFSVIV